ncbi:MAG: DNA-binding protein [Pseudonocardiales bacterium]|nr:MAG: DNA-binding protein [Pseudonocardiales bacterium]
MTEWTFRLTLRGIELTDEQLDALHEAGCDDGSFSAEPDGTVLGFFDREASTEQDAVISAIVDVEHAGINARVIRVQADDDWLTATEIAARVGRSRQSVALLARGERGPGDFPAPAARRSSSNPLWGWSEVEEWFERYEPEAVQAHAPRLSPDFLAEVNDRLDLRERLRHSPNAPWRPKLNEALPLGA